MFLLSAPYNYLCSMEQQRNIHTLKLMFAVDTCRLISVLIIM